MVLIDLELVLAAAIIAASSDEDLGLELLVQLNIFLDFLVTVDLINNVFDLLAELAGMAEDQSLWLIFTALDCWFFLLDFLDHGENKSESFTLPVLCLGNQRHVVTTDEETNSLSLDLGGNLVTDLEEILDQPIRDLGILPCFVGEVRLFVLGSLLLGETF